MRTKGNYRHGHAPVGAPSKEYRAWAEMKKRCLNPKFHGFHKYGGRGIAVCERWKTSFQAFLEDVGPAPDPMYSLDRIDVNGHYEPGNVRWATIQEQNWNTRQNVCYEWAGRSLPLGKWAVLTGIKRKTISKRIHSYGWSLERALTTPTQKWSRRS